MASKAGVKPEPAPIPGAPGANGTVLTTKVRSKRRYFPGPFPRFRIYRNFRSYANLIGDAAVGRVTHGKDVETFETALTRFLEAPHAICTCMARVGIHFAVKGLITPGQDVVMSPYTIADVVNMVISAGGRPLFADIERNTCNIDPGAVRSLVGSNTGAVLVTHLHGAAARVLEIRDICHKMGVPMIEDAAQALGGMTGGLRLGTIGDAGVYSFGMYKNLNAWYGGAVVTPHRDLAVRIRAEMAEFNWQTARAIVGRLCAGMVTDVATAPALFRLMVFWVFRHALLNNIEPINRLLNTERDVKRLDVLPPHYRKRFTPSQARIAIRQLDRIDSDARTRIHNAAIYRANLEGLPGITLPPASEGLNHVYSHFPVQVEDRSRFLKWMFQHNRDVAAQHLTNCADLPIFEGFARECPNARAAAATTVVLPTYPRYPLDQIEANIDAIRSYFVRRSGS